MMKFSNNKYSAVSWGRTSLLALLTATASLGALGACDQAPRDDIEDDRAIDDGCLVEQRLTLEQAAWNPSSGDYEYGHNSIPSLAITGAPEDVDPSRWAMHHNGSYWLYLMNTSGTRIHQFKFAGGTYQYQNYSFALVGFPASADKSSFAMLNDGANTRLYFLNQSKDKLIQGAYDPGADSFVYGYQSGDIPIINGPGNDDWSGWGMLHSGTNYHLYSYAPGKNALYQYMYDAGKQAYDHQFPDIIPRLDVVGFSDRKDFAMLHDGSAYRLYMQGTPQTVAVE